MLHHHKSSKIIDKWAVVSICMLNNQRVMPSIIILFGSVPKMRSLRFLVAASKLQNMQNAVSMKQNSSTVQ